jgi:hypothetical protein
MEELPRVKDINDTINKILWDHKRELKTIRDDFWWNFLWRPREIISYSKPKIFKILCPIMVFGEKRTCNYVNDSFFKKLADKIKLDMNEANIPFDGKIVLQIQPLHEYKRYIWEEGLENLPYRKLSPYYLSIDGDNYILGFGIDCIDGAKEIFLKK